MKRTSLLFVTLALLVAMRESAGADMPDIAALDQRMPEILNERKVAGAGIAIIIDGRVEWSGYYGEQAPGTDVTANTLFNTASVAKTVTAETVLRLASRADIDIHEKISRHFVLSALADDPRHWLLTPARILSHQAGLLNWPYAYDDGKMAFVADPGTTFSYSGMAYEMLALYLEKKLDEPFNTLVGRVVFEPLDMKSASISASACRHPDAAVPMNANGDYVERCSNMAPGDWSAADNLYTTVEDYARFLIAVMHDAGLADAIAEQRNLVRVSLAGDATWRCIEAVGIRCPDEYGYGLGWMIYRYGDSTIFKHGGNDFGESALAYFEKESRSGAVIFVNGGNGFLVTVDVLALLNQQPELAAYYKRLATRHYGEAAFSKAD